MVTPPSGTARNVANRRYENLNDDDARRTGRERTSRPPPNERNATHVDAIEVPVSVGVERARGRTGEACRIQALELLYLLGSDDRRERLEASGAIPFGRDPEERSGTKRERRHQTRGYEDLDQRETVSSGLWHAEGWSNPRSNSVRTMKRARKRASIARGLTDSVAVDRRNQLPSEPIRVQKLKKISSPNARAQDGTVASGRIT
jgi:hypothetical protein